MNTLPAVVGELVARWRESARGGSQYSTTEYENGCTAELRRCADELEQALSALTAEAGKGGDSQHLCIRFGVGGVAVSTGTHGGEPCVFLREPPEPGEVGAPLGHAKEEMPLRVALLFPTAKQATAVMDALVPLALSTATPAGGFFPIPAGLHPHTANLVARFAEALAEKLAKAERKYGYSDGWASPDWMDECRAKLMEHVAKGDPRDVAAYCAFLWHHNERTAPVLSPATPAGEWRGISEAPEDAPIHSIPVLLWGPEMGVRTGTYTKFYADKDQVPFLADGWSVLGSQSEITHWQPLPAPPLPAKTGERK